MRFSLLVIIGLLIFASCKTAGLIYTRDGKIECGGNGEAIILRNNPDAVNPTFDEMVAFIRADPTDYRDYVQGVYVCSDFAEDVHNNAEAAGIRAGWVSITFAGTDEGHALNSFETTDRGLVYIDCTSGESVDRDNERQSRDAVAYIETGKKYGILNIDLIASSPYEYYPLQYDFYADCEREWLEYKTMADLFNQEVDRYNSEVSNKVFVYGSPEGKRITAWKEELELRAEVLEEMGERLGDRWYKSEFSEYIVKDIQIHW
jgi:hypothetical protein